MATASGSSDLAVASWSEPEGHPSKSDRYLAKRLAAASADYKGVAVATFLLAACVAAMAWILFGIGLEHWMIAGGLPSWARWTWFVAGLVALAAAIVRWIVPLLRYRVNLVYAARAIEADHPELHNDLVNAVLVKARPDGAAAKVVRSLERRAAKRLAQVPNDGVVDRTAAFRLALALAALVVGAGVYELTAPKSLLVSGARLIAPWAGLAAPTRVTIGAPRLSWRQPGAAPQAGGDPEGRVLEVAGGSATLVRGRQLLVSSEIRGLRTDEKPSLIVGPIREDGTIDQAAVWRLPMVPVHRGASGGAEGDPGQSAAGRSARGLRHLVVVPDAARGLEEDVEFFISAGDASSNRVRISIVDTPSLLVREVRYEYPAYTGREPETVAWQGDLRAVEGTQATIVAEGNRPLGSAWIDLDCDGKRDVKLHVGQHDLTRATGNFRLQLKKDRSGPEHGSYRFVFQPIQPHAAKAAAVGEEPIVEKLEHRIEVVPDLPPEVSIEEPREPVLAVPPGAPVEVRVRATDPDFALAGVAVEMRLRGGAALPPLAVLSKVHAGVFRGAVRIVPETLGAVPGSVLEYRAVAVDTRQDAPNKTASPWQSLRIDPSAPPPRQPPPRDGANQPRQGGEAAAGANPSDQPPGKPGQEEGSQSADESAENQSRGGPSGPEGRQDSKAATQGRQNGDQGDPSQKNEGSQSEDRQSQLPQKQDSRNQDPQKKDAEKNQDQKNQDQKNTDKNSKDQQGQGPGAASQKSESEQAQSGGQGDDSKGQGGADAKRAENKAGEKGGGEKGGGENKAADNQAGENNAAEKKAAENKDGSAGQAGGGKAAGGKQAGGKESGGQQTADNASGGKAGGKQAADGRAAERGQSGEKRGGGDRAGKPQDTVAADGTNDGEAMDRILNHRRRQEEASRQGGGKSDGGDGAEKKEGAESGAKSDGPNEKPALTSEKNEQGKAGDKPESAQQTAAQKPAACADAQGKPCGKQGCSSCGGGSKSNGGGSGSSGAAGGRDGQSQQDGKDQQGHSQGQNQGQQGQGQQGQGQQGQGQQGQGQQGQGQQGQGQQGQGRDGQGKQGQGQPGQGQQGQGQQGQGEQGQADAGQGSGQKQEGQPGKAEGRGGEGQSQSGKSGEGRPGAPGREQSADGKQGDGKQGDGRPGQSAQGQGNTAQQQGGGGQQPGPGKDQAGGDRAGQDQAGQQQAGKEQPGKEQTGKPGGDQAGDRAAEPGQGKSPASGDRAEGQSGGQSNAPAEPQPDGTQPASGSQVGAGGRTGGRGGSGADGVAGPPPDRELEWTAEDLAHARNAADLAIEHLRDSVESGRQDVLDALGWTPEQARAFLERWQAMRRSAGSSDPRQRGEFEQTLRSLGLRPGGARNTRDVPTDVQGGQAEGRRSRPPASYREQLKAYLRGTSGE